MFPFKSVYIAFDQHPSYKGASTHIAHMCKVLSESYGPTLLLTVEGPLPKIECKNISQLCFVSEEQNVLKRALLFSSWVKEILDKQDALLVGHFRDVWGGMAVLSYPHILPVFEVNGLPSVEWPYRYPQLTNATHEKLKHLEDYCLAASALVLTPSEVIKKHLLNRGVAEEKVKLLSNGADLPTNISTTPVISGEYILYFGALQAWQGLDVLIKAMRYLEDKTALKLVVCASHTEHHCKAYRKFAEKIGVQERIIWLYQLDKEKLQNVISHAYASIAPLVECSRNLEQGCSPLKIFESMACGTPVIASDLPVARDIIQPEVNGVLVRPGRPAELARAIRFLLDYPQQRDLLSENARQTIIDQFTWDHIEENLAQFYEQVYTYSFGYSKNNYRYG
jgi:glycosyltransferase involved in cell wall biosynthesis